MLARRFVAFILTLALAGSMVPLAIAEAAAARSVNADAVIPDGLEITVVTTEEITSKTAREGDPVIFRVDEDVVVDDHIVIVKGSLVRGVISDAESSGRLGKGGKLGIRIESTAAVDGQRIRLRAAKTAAGADKTAATVVLVALVGVFGFFKKGDNAKIKSGTKITVFTDESKRVRLKGGGLI